jgi:hypothetical protein
MHHAYFHRGSDSDIRLGNACILDFVPSIFANQSLFLGYRTSHTERPRHGRASMRQGSFVGSQHCSYPYVI